MRWRLIAMVSLGVNIALFVALLVMRAHAPDETGFRTEQAASTNIAPAKPDVVIRRQFFSWRDLESPDYPTYVANLRDIGCPEQTIRDIIIADVNALFAKRLATELVTTDQQWWRAEPDPDVQAAAVEKIHLIEGERRHLLASLLGSSWETGDLANLPRPSREGVVLDGPVLGMMNSETKQVVQDVALKSDERMTAYIENARAQGKEPDPAMLAKLRQQTRDELAKVLTPPQLEEYLLRYSQTASNLRQQFGDLQYFDASPDEFRQVFRAIDNIEQRLSLLGDSTDPNMVQMRRTLATQRENAIRTALGNRRYEEYRMLQDADYRQAVAQAQEAGTPEAARTIYTINLAAAAEQNSIQSNTNLTAEQKNVELKRLELDQLKASTLASGKELPPEQPPLPIAPQPRTYTVRPGENAAVIGMLHGVPLNMLRAANPGVDLSRLRPGDVVTVPRSPAPEPSLPVPFPE